MSDYLAMCVALLFYPHFSILSGGYNKSKKQTMDCITSRLPDARTLSESRRPRLVESQERGFCCHRDAPLPWFVIEYKAIGRLPLVPDQVVVAILRSAAGCPRTAFLEQRL
jgi:hypothetical protein